jgi:hypothetical protein
MVFSRRSRLLFQTKTVAPLADKGQGGFFIYYEITITTFNLDDWPPFRNDCSVFG